MLELLPARPLVEPTWWACPPYEFTYGPEVCDVAALADFAPDPEQANILNGMFGVAESGKSSAFEVDIFGPRQNIKTGTIIQASLGWLYVLELPDVIYSAQNLDAAEECWALMASLIERTPALSRRLKSSRGERPGIVEGKGSWAINLKGDRSMVFRTRGAHTGRSLRAARVVLDEGYAVTRTHIGGMLPVLSALWDPQYVLASSAGKVDSEVAKDARDRGRSGGTYRQLYAEYGDKEAGKGCQLGDRCDHGKPPNGPPGCALDDEERWARIMPALGGRVQVETIRGLRLSMPPEEFARECMVWWDVEGATVSAFDMAAWHDAGTDAEPPKPEAIAIAASYDQAWGSIGAVGTVDGKPYLGAVRRARGTGWLVDEAVRIAKEHDVKVVIDGKGPASHLIPDLEEAGVEVLIASTDDYVTACATVYELAQNGGLCHGKHPDLDEAVLLAALRTVGDRFAWARRGGDISMLEAATLALFGARETAEPEPSALYL